MRTLLKNPPNLSFDYNSRHLNDYFKLQPLRQTKWQLLSRLDWGSVTGLDKFCPR